MNLRPYAPLLALSLAVSSSAQRSIVVAGTGEGTGSLVRVFNGATLGTLATFSPFGSSFTGGVRVAAGDVNGDGFPDVIAAAGPSAAAGPHVKVFDGRDFSVLRQFDAFDAAFQGGVNVSAGDVNGDGLADVVVGAGAGGGSHVRVFDGSTGGTLFDRMVFVPGNVGGVAVGAGDLDGDGRADLIVGAGPGAGPHVKTFSGASLVESNSFFAYDAAYTGGVNVALGDINGDGLAELVTGAASGTPHLKTFSARGGETGSFFAFGPNSGGVRVAGYKERVGHLILAGSETTPQIRIFDSSFTQIADFMPFGSGVGTGVFVAGATAVPEPATLAVLGLGVVTFAQKRRNARQG